VSGVWCVRAGECGSGMPLCEVARCCIIAAGGAGQVYSDTTNPAVATGDGIALAARSGAALADMEFYQFTLRRFRSPARRDSCSRGAAREGASCSTTAASASWSAINRCSNSLPATSSPAPSRARAWAPFRRIEGRSSRHATVNGIDLHRRFPRHQRLFGKVRPRPCSRPHPRPPAGALP